MPSGTIEIFVRCYVEVERIMSAMDRNNLMNTEPWCGLSFYSQ